MRRAHAEASRQTRDSQKPPEQSSLARVHAPFESVPRVSFASSQPSHNSGRRSPCPSIGPGTVSPLDPSPLPQSTPQHQRTRISGPGVSRVRSPSRTPHSYANASSTHKCACAILCMTALRGEANSDTLRRLWRQSSASACSHRLRHLCRHLRRSFSSSPAHPPPLPQLLSRLPPPPPPPAPPASLPPPARLRDAVAPLRGFGAPRQRCPA